MTTSKIKTIGMTSGCFDGLHDGHAHFLKNAKDLCDVLVVALDSDKSVRKLKGECRPRESWAARRRKLYEIGDYADLVLWFEDQEHLIDIVTAIKPDVYIKGAEYIANEKLHSWKKHRLVGSLAFVEMLPGYSTTLLTGFDYAI